MTQTQSITINTLFDLVAPIAICGGADCAFENKAVEAWYRISLLSPGIWKQFGCLDPNDEFETPLRAWNLRDNDDFAMIYREFALPAYNSLFSQIVAENGDGKWEEGYDYWGAKGFKRPGNTNKSFALSGDSEGQFPWFETAELLVKRVKELER